MQPAPYLTVRPLPVEPGDFPVCDLLAYGQPVGQSVGGAVLEAAYRTAGHILLFMTDDVPQEEGLTVHLLTHDYQYVESAGVAWPYASGTFRDARVIDERRLAFRFIGEREVMVEILPRPQFRLPFIPDFIGLFRPFGFRRHMRFSRL